MSQSSSNNSISIFGFMEGLWDLKKIIKFTYYAIFLDVLVMIFTHKGIFYLSIENRPELTIGSIVGLIISFGLFSIMSLEFISLMFFSLLIRIRFTSLFKSEHDNFMRNEVGEVSIYKMRDEALNNQSDFEYRIYKEAKDKYDNQRKKQRRDEIISVGLFVLILVDVYLSVSDGSTQSFIDWLWTILHERDESVTHFFVSTFVIIISALYATIICWPRETKSSVYYPPLYRRLKEVDDKRKKEQREFEMKMRRMLEDNKKQ